MGVLEILLQVGGFIGGLLEILLQVGWFIGGRPRNPPTSRGFIRSVLRTKPPGAKRERSLRSGPSRGEKKEERKRGRRKKEGKEREKEFLAGVVLCCQTNRSKCEYMNGKSIHVFTFV